MVQQQNGMADYTASGVWCSMMLLPSESAVLQSGLDCSPAPVLVLDQSGTMTTVASPHERTCARPDYPCCLRWCPPQAPADPLTPGRDGFARASRRRVGSAAQRAAIKKDTGRASPRIMLHRDPQYRALASHRSPPGDVHMMDPRRR